MAEKITSSATTDDYDDDDDDEDPTYRFCVRSMFHRRELDDFFLSLSPFRFSLFHSLQRSVMSHLDSTQKWPR